MVHRALLPKNFSKLQPYLLLSAAVHGTDGERPVRPVCRNHYTTTGSARPHSPRVLHSPGPVVNSASGPTRRGRWRRRFAHHHRKDHRIAGRIGPPFWEFFDSPCRCSGSLDAR
ncbi:hypothetical protein DFH06DRAFT_1472814, partial [Mycena polygramma]